MNLFVFSISPKSYSFLSISLSFPLVRFIPRYFILCDAIGNRIFLISLSDSLMWEGWYKTLWIPLGFSEACYEDSCHESRVATILANLTSFCW